MIKAILFDMDGVMIDSEPYYINQVMAFFKLHHVPCEYEELQKMIGGSIQYVDTILKQIWKRKFQDKDFNCYFEMFEKEHPIHYPSFLFEDVKPLLHELKKRKLKIGLASSSPKEDIREMLSTCELTSFFDEWISGEEVLVSKPNSEIYLKLMQRLCVQNNECLVFEDSAFGIKAAKNAQIYTIARKCNLKFIDQSEADVCIESALELLNFLE